MPRKGKWHQGDYQVRNPEKYVGNHTPRFRSSWELAMMTFFDTNPNVIQWSSESIFINYMNPLTGKATIYVPDFLVVFVDKKGKKHGQIIEVKPSTETTMEAAGKSYKNKLAVMVNMAKWAAARAWCKMQGLEFVVMNEGDIYVNPKKRRRKSR